MVPASLSRGVFSWDTCKLADEYNSSELASALQEVRNAPESQMPPHQRGVYMLTKKARKSTDALAWAIRYRQQERRAAP